MGKVRVMLPEPIIDAFGVVCSEFTGDLPRETLTTLMRAAIGLVLPSIDEQIAEIEAAAKPTIEKHTHYHVPNGAVLSVTGDLVRIEPWMPSDARSTSRPMLDPGTLPKTGEFADVRVEVLRCSDGLVYFKSDDGREACRRYSDIVQP